MNLHPDLLPEGMVIGPPHRGTFQGLPVTGHVYSMLGETSKGQVQRVRVLHLNMLLLMQGSLDLYPEGAFSMEFPLIGDNIQKVAHLLNFLGWTGEIWHKDREDLDPAVRGMLKGKLVATLGFVPDPVKGAATIEIGIERAKGPFFMPFPEVPEEEELDPDLTAALAMDLEVLEPSAFIGT